MIKRNNTIRFDRNIDIRWSNYTVELLLRGLSITEIREKLIKDLSVYNLGSSKGGALSKTVSLLLRTWINIDEKVVDIRDNAIAIYESSNDKEKVGISLCMSISNFPFFFDVLTQIGRLYRLQGNFSYKQVLRRIIENWGDTQRVSRCLRYVFQTLKLWNIIRASDTKSIYTIEMLVLSDKHQILVVKSLLIHLGGYEIEDVVNHPSTFFCKLTLSRNYIEKLSSL